MSAPPRPSTRARVVVANPADGGVVYWTAKLYGFAAVTLLAVVASVGIGYGRSLAGDAPPAPDLRRYATDAPGVARMLAADGTLLAEFASEWREVVPYEQIPKQLVDAFLAIEDHAFFEHDGVSWRGMARAAWANVSAGDFAQGGSTITQQVAKQFLGSEKSMTRKAKEAVMARRLEAEYSKRAILAVYLNHIALDARAFGVAAAAKRFFQKDLAELTLAECALLAGLPKAPTDYSPLNYPDRAKARRDLVLDRMQQHGFATPEAVAAAKAEPLTLRPYRDVFPSRMPYYAEHVRRTLIEQHGEPLLSAEERAWPKVATGPKDAELARKRRKRVTELGLAEISRLGLVIETAAEPSFEAGAYENAAFGARHQDKRQGWRGPEWHVDGSARETLVARQRELYGTGPLAFDRRYLAIVDEVDGNGAVVVVGDRRLELPLRNLRWAAPWQPGSRAPNDLTVGSATRVLKAGDVVWVARERRTLGRFREWYLPDGTNPSWRPAEDERAWDEAHPDVVTLEQVPHPQTALFTADHGTGYVVAMAGGHDYARSEFNRATQACRQPGSTYKPIYYAAALDGGYGFDTMLNDKPITITDPVTGLAWSPENLNATLDGDVTLEYAMVFSKNIPSVDIFQKVGARPVEAWARRLGFSTEIIPDDALALGASCVKLDEITRAFALFARDGAWWPRPDAERDWVYVRRVLDRRGEVVEDHTVPQDPRLAAADRFDRLATVAGVTPTQAIPARTGFLMNKLLGQTIRHGFSKVVRATELQVAGKTGTSSDTHDTWFIAYTSRFITTSWMGDDKKQRALGRDDAAYMTAEPLWVRYMEEVAGAYPSAEIPWRVPPGVDPDDRGDHKLGRHGSRSDLIYKSAKSILRRAGLAEDLTPLPPGEAPPP